MLGRGGTAPLPPPSRAAGLLGCLLMPSGPMCHSAVSPVLSSVVVDVFLCTLSLPLLSEQMIPLHLLRVISGHFLIHRGTVTARGGYTTREKTCSTKQHPEGFKHMRLIAE